MISFCCVEFVSGLSYDVQVGDAGARLERPVFGYPCSARKFSPVGAVGCQDNPERENGGSVNCFSHDHTLTPCLIFEQQIPSQDFTSCAR
jgi:hypothetical protein